MTCRHSPGDPACSSHPDNIRRRAEEAHQEKEKKLRAEVEARQRELDARTPNPDAFTVENVEAVGDMLVMQVKYPNCAKCAYEGLKTMVFKGVDWKSAIKWKRIDPHFRGPVSKHLTPNEAPSPIARFPGSPEGWQDAVNYAQAKAKERG